MEICNHTLCTACGTCVNVCSKNAITMKADGEGFPYPVIDESCCVKCGLCQKSCPVNKDTQASEATFYMAWHKYDSVLQKSSSGGAFTAIADYVLSRKGVVFGAAKKTDTQEVCHIMIDDEDGLNKLRLSKYYQSDTKKVYQQEMLKQNRYVLFSGTACQVAGLYSALERWKINVNFPEKLTLSLFHGHKSTC
ncbi:4Fe-4S binding protein [Blautia liquoris]|uniref:4Fe-4S binding protein n=1 Tax=Blautia liquoris TaxID=2779518 RepID=A0A7M2RHQ3_9FIRM|nr:4Fe-4S dicluster domain-containing protein [Blautia liquoris]QOV18870.1 4Fe-4S binding protein [Blautia liquoris]